MYRIPIYQVMLVRDGSQPSVRKKVDSPSTAAHVLQEYLDGADREHFVVLLLDTQNQIIGIHTVTIGTLDASLIHPREIFKPVILANAASVILAHNHPSGILRPPPKTAPSPVSLLLRALRWESKCSITSLLVSRSVITASENADSWSR